MVCSSFSSRKTTSINFRLWDNRSIVEAFESDRPFDDARRFIAGVLDLKGQFTLVQMYPRREFTTQDLLKPFLELGLAPRSVIMVFPVSVSWNVVFQFLYKLYKKWFSREIKEKQLAPWSSIKKTGSDPSSRYWACLLWPCSTFSTRSFLRHPTRLGVKIEAPSEPKLQCKLFFGFFVKFLSLPVTHKMLLVDRGRLRLPTGTKATCADWTPRPVATRTTMQPGTETRRSSCDEANSDSNICVFCEEIPTNGYYIL